MVFRLEVGAMFALPEGHLAHRWSNSQHKQAETPAVYRLRKRDLYYEFKLASEDDGFGGGFVLFAPDFLIPGDKVQVIWVDTKCACVRRWKESEPFGLELGTIIEVPAGPLLSSKSRNAEENPHTPRVYYLNQHRDDRFTFRTGIGGKLQGFVLFVPADVKPLDKLVVAWRDPKCAAAYHLVEAPVDTFNVVANPASAPPA